MTSRGVINWNSMEVRRIKSRIVSALQQILPMHLVGDRSRANKNLKSKFNRGFMNDVRKNEMRMGFRILIAHFWKSKDN
jgi:hypothetical protein